MNSSVSPQAATAYSVAETNKWVDDLLKQGREELEKSVGPVVLPEQLLLKFLLLLLLLLLFLFFLLLFALVVVLPGFRLGRLYSTLSRFLSPLMVHVTHIEASLSKRL